MRGRVHRAAAPLRFEKDEWPEMVVDHGGPVGRYYTCAQGLEHQSGAASNHYGGSLVTHVGPSQPGSSPGSHVGASHPSQTP